MKTMILTVLFTLVSIANAATQSLSAKGGEVEILAVGKPSFIKIRGKGDPPQGQVDVQDAKVTGTFEFDLKSLDTGIGLRNEHMRDKYLQVNEHPKAKLQIEKVELKDGWSLAKPAIKSAPFSGQLTLHGVTKPVSGTVSVSEAKAVEAAFKIKLSDFAIDIPKYMGITVADDVEVAVKIAGLEPKAK